MERAKAGSSSIELACGGLANPKNEHRFIIIIIIIYFNCK
jgi:hypothetical protein